MDTLQQFLNKTPQAWRSLEYFDDNKDHSKPLFYEFKPVQTQKESGLIQHIR